MKIFTLLLILISFAFSDQYVFLVNKYDKETEFEAKIISKIALSSIKEKIKLFIPEISEKEKEIYSKYFNLTQDCNSANFIFDNKGVLNRNCEVSNKLFFTNNYRRLIANDKYYGAFFWSKSRPNIVFIKQRLRDNNVQLSKEYLKYIEDINE
jgi:hypothetical protein